MHGVDYTEPFSYLAAFCNKCRRAERQIVSISFARKMAPKRKRNTVATGSASSPAATRGTRSSPRLANAAPPPPIANPEPRKRRKKVASASASSPVTAVEQETEVQEPPPAIANPEPSNRRKKAITAPVTTVEEETEVQEQPPPTAEKDPVSEPENVDVLKTIVVEHCKQYKSFETMALQVKESLERDVQGVRVVVNPEEPRKGCFEVREEDGEVFFRLLDMKRPFKPMMEQDMVEVISKFVEKIR